ncbi:MAG: alanine--tRNA ligase [Candidatus Aminicenantes bacterium]
MKAQQIREAFLDFFARKKHKIVKSSSLLPKDDPTLLFINAGMNQFKDVFLGLEKRSYRRAASVQKCMRVSGKHNDLEQVGKTNKHHTFFEMLGNFSFGDYFKQEAIAYAWELVTEIYGIDKQKIYITVYKDDDEAFRIWNEEIKIPHDRIFRFGKEHNYWAMGETGPCGPCSELHYDIDSSIEKGDPYTLIKEGSDRFLELWNLVFMQYYQDEKGKLSPLPSPSIDTGMGLERLAACLQGKKSNFHTDLFLPLIEAVCDLSQREYPADQKGDTAVRIIADHVRAISFMIGDGIMPSNEGRGYVLRRLIRRAYRQGKSLGLDEPFLYRLAGVVSDIMKDAYPELLSSINHISKVCLSEERRFASTLASGLRTFHQYVEETRRKGRKVLSGSKVFKLYDTFGFPVDLCKELAEEKELGVDEQGFRKELEKQRQRARLSWRGEDLQKSKKFYQDFKDLSVRFVGYEESKISEAKVAAILKDGKPVPELKKEEKGEIILDETPFYAEAGGQVGDAGILKNPRFSAVVQNTHSPIPGLIVHQIKVLSGKIKVNDEVEAAIDISLRRAISDNHTATHLLHASLRQILGDHVKQAGSLVSPSRLRFDFTHFSPLTPQELTQVENLVNEKIREDLPVRTRITTLEQGLKEGAAAIFEEKYGEKVRMVVIDDFSKELCGGVHVHSTGEIGLFKIISESSIASGMRRIEALTAEQALTYVQNTENLIQEMEQSLSSSREELLPQIEKLKESLKEKEKESKSLRQKMAHIKYKPEPQEARKIKGIQVLVREVEGLTQAELRELADSLKQKIGSGIVVLGAASDGKVFLVASVTKDLVSRVKADEFIKKIAPLIGGGGGGRPDFAQAGGSKTSHLKKTLKISYSLLEDMIK